MKRMFIDDEREPIGDDWIIIRSEDDFIKWIQEDKSGFWPDFVSFDHDLGSDCSGYSLARWMIDDDLDAWGRKFPEGFRFEVHSQNPVGKGNIEGLFESYFRFKDHFII